MLIGLSAAISRYIPGLSRNICFSIHSVLFIPLHFLFYCSSICLCFCLSLIDRVHLHQTNTQRICLLNLLKHRIFLRLFWVIHRISE